MPLLLSAPGAQLPTAQGRLWGAVHAVTYYADHLRLAGRGGRPDSAWFGQARLLKQAAWDEARAVLDGRARFSA
ncbi:MAG: hypothetical protein IT499_22840 [Rubrivivax sp.]|nr:hypothetical protein [Rubrivivax sp.]MCL4695730.1 hypothetical protein [Burkholderiaceae bacterium]